MAPSPAAAGPQCRLLQSVLAYDVSEQSVKDGRYYSMHGERPWAAVGLRLFPTTTNVLVACCVASGPHLGRQASTVGACHSLYELDCVQLSNRQWGYAD
jgi:hypothetical protein